MIPNVTNEPKRITLDIYGHLKLAKQREAASLMNQLLTPVQIDLTN